MTIKFEVGKKYKRSCGGFLPRACVAVADGCVYFGPTEKDGHPICFRIDDVKEMYKEHRVPVIHKTRVLWFRNEHDITFPKMVSPGTWRLDITAVGRYHAGCKATLIGVQDVTFTET